jgi:hypothetical protein
VIERTSPFNHTALNIKPRQRIARSVISARITMSPGVSRPLGLHRMSRKGFYKYIEPDVHRLPYISG